MFVQGKGKHHDTSSSEAAGKKAAEEFLLLSQEEDVHTFPTSSASANRSHTNFLWTFKKVHVHRITLSLQIMDYKCMYSVKRSGLQQ